MTISMNYNIPSAKCQKPSFKGRMAVTDNGTPYYKTNNGAKVGAVYGAMEAIDAIGFNGSFLGAILGLGICTGIGAYIDKKRNQHAAEAADYINQVGAKKALKTRHDLAVSSNNRLYYKSKDGVKYGTVIGGGIGLITSIFPMIALTLAGASQKAKDRLAGVKGFGASVTFGALLTGIFALGGYILGRITDYYTNKNAEKHA